MASIWKMASDPLEYRLNRFGAKLRSRAYCRATPVVSTNYTSPDHSWHPPRARGRTRSHYRAAPSRRRASRPSSPPRKSRSRPRRKPRSRPRQRARRRPRATKALSTSHAQHSTGNMAHRMMVSAMYALPIVGRQWHTVVHPRSLPMSHPMYRRAIQGKWRSLNMN